ncbi:MAG: C40 family peptidase [Pyrinomonadaceae bacterium]|nr:C40 family peptidase [Pyrinomonadaceae bacterium]
MRFLVSFKKVSIISFCMTLALVSFASETSAQRKRVVEEEKKSSSKEATAKDKSTRPTVQHPRSPKTSRPSLTNELIIRKRTQDSKSLVKKTASTKAKTRAVKRRAFAYRATTRAMMMQSIRSKLGIRYRLGTSGPRSYDCSGFVWKVFQQSGIPFTRTSARHFWRTFDKVYGDDRYEFGTLVFFNRLGHVGIVVDKKGFYHASSSRGVMYSKFSPYWRKRTVGFRRVPVYYSQADF